MKSIQDLIAALSLKEVAEIKNIITSDAGEIYHEDVWGIREFAYTIKKHDEGFYIVLNFKVEGNKIHELEKELNLNQKVIRYLISKTPKHYEIKTLEDYQAIAAKEAAEKEKEENARSRKLEQYLKQLSQNEGTRPINPTKLFAKPG